MPNNTPQDIVLLGTPNNDGTWTGVTVDETYSQWIPPFSHDKAVIVIIGNGTTSSGVVSIQENFVAANQAEYKGTPSTITTVNASDVTGGAQKAIHISANALLPIRVGITTVIGGGGGISAVLRYQ